MRFLILGDSLTFGRPNHDIRYEDTWPGLLELSGHNVFHRGRGGADSRVVLNEARHLYGYLAGPTIVDPPFDYCLIQVGIVDCTPRLFPIKIYQLAMILPAIRDIFTWLTRKPFLIKLAGRSSVNLKDFAKNVTEIIRTVGPLAKKIIFIEIAKPRHFLVRNCGDFSDVVEEYNAVLKSNGDGVCLSAFDDADLKRHLLPDGHHLTHSGHRIIAEKILKIIQEI